jgi:amidohydrolase
VSLDLIEIRKKLHKNPELSGKEKNTSEHIVEILKKLSPDEIITEIGGFGIVAVFDSKKSGTTIMFRAELDAIAIAESNNFSYKSKNNGISHKCGHDGHMTILIGLAEKIKQEISNLKGKIILLFQPAEETAEGAKLVLEDPKFRSLKPDYIFALHNLPGFEKGSIILRKGIFASSSKGMIVKLKGESAHAAQPETGNNPVLAMIDIIEGLIAIPQKLTSINNSALITIIHAKLGERAFGTSPGNAQVMATFRSHKDEIMKIMTTEAISLVKEKAIISNLDYEIEWVEYFPAIVNNDESVDIIEVAAKNLGKKIIYEKYPFAWTEDFSYFTQKFKGALFGLGSGNDIPQLHNSNYDFPDDIIKNGINIFFEIINEIQRRK